MCLVGGMSTGPAGVFSRRLLAGEGSWEALRAAWRQCPS